MPTLKRKVKPKPYRALHERISKYIPAIFSTLNSVFNKELSLSYQLNLSSPAYFMRKDNKFLYLKFQTSDKNSEYALDYPSDLYISEFVESPEVVSKHGFEMTEASDKVEEW